VALGALGGCGRLLGVDSKEFTDAPPDARRCAALAPGEASLRFSHAGPGLDSVSLCSRKVGEQGWTPLFTSAEGCPAGLAYGEVSAVFAVEAGGRELRVSPSGKGCEEAIASGSAAFEPGQLVEVVLHAGAGGGFALEAWGLPPLSGGELRVIDAVGDLAEVTLQTDAGAVVAAAGPVEQGAPGTVVVGAGVGELAVLSGGVELARVSGPFPAPGAALIFGRHDDAIFRPRLVVCGDDGEGGPLSRCQASPLPSLTIDTLNVYLTQNEFATAERQPALIDALKASPAEVICLQEVPMLADERAAFLASLEGEFPFIASFSTDSSTPVDSPTTSDGQLPAPLPSPPCDGLELELQSFLACAQENCSTIPGSAEGHLTSEPCFIDACGQGILGLLDTFERKRCAKCIRTEVADYSLNDAVSACTEAHSMPLSHGGTNDVVILSRVPLSATERWVLPSTGQRRVVVFARVAKAGAPTADVYCTRMTSIYDGVYDVYYGQYGEGKDGPAAWAAEQRLEALKIQEYIAGRSREQRAVLAGWLGASRGVKDGDEIVIEGFGPETLTVLDSLLVSASSPADDARCTACKANPLYDDSYFDRRPDHVFLRGFDLQDVASMSVVYDALTVTVKPTASSKGRSLVPVSDSYGLRAQIRLAR
jgi:hypothetical protein